MSEPKEFSKKKVIAVIAGAILLIAAFLIYRSFPLLDGKDTQINATHLSAIVLIGLSLTVVFMALLAIIYTVLGVEDKSQPLALPEGSVRALLAFSLVLIFVCLGAFLFNEVNDKTWASSKETLSRVNDAQLSDLKTNFTVAAEQAIDKDGKLVYEQIPDPKSKKGNSTIDDLKHPLYSVTYYPKQSKDASDFAKQIFTTLATIFISVVSFYFGSSVTSSATKAGAAAAQGTDGDKKLVALQATLANALADSHNADVAVGLASKNLDQAKQDAANNPGDSQKAAAVTAAEKALDNVTTDLKDKQAKVVSAQNALKEAKGAS